MGTTGGNGDGARGALMGGDTWVIVGEWGRGYRGTNGRRHMGTTGGNGGGATGALVRGDTWILFGSGGGATGALVGGDTWILVGEWGRGYRGTSGRRHMDTSGGVGAGLQGH